MSDCCLDIGACRNRVIAVGTDMSAHARPHRQHQRQRGETFPDFSRKAPARLIQIGRQRPDRSVLPVPECKVHQQEREVVLNVQVRQNVAELDAIEQHCPLALEQDVAQMQITVTASGKPGRAAMSQ